MDSRLLARTDLNLLKALQVLLEERNVTRAAERLYITQPAMSKTLTRLRSLFDDPLFTRSGKGLVPTPKAEEIAMKLPPILASVEELVSHETFDPGSYVGEIKIMVAAFFAYQLMPRFVEMLASEAPGITICVMSQALETVNKDLESGELDFAVLFASPTPADIYTTALGTISPSVWMRKEHPLAKNEKISLKEILEYPFVQYHIMQTGPVSKSVETRFDKEIAKKGLTRTRLMITNQFMTAIETLERTNCLMLSAINENIPHSAYGGTLVEKPYPQELKYETNIPMVMLQHLRTLKSPVHNWIKQRLLDVIVKAQH